jgi:thioredoxin 1
MNITDKNFEEITNGDLPVLVDFSAIWCGPCKMMLPIIEELSNEYEGKVVIGKMDVDTNVETPAKYGVRSIPTLLFFKNGEIVDRLVGSQKKDVLTAKLDTLL